MGNVTIVACDHCGKRVDNPYAERGWIRFITTSASLLSISRSVGRMGPSGHLCDFLRGARDFCGITCFTAALDEQARKREDASVTATGAAD